MGIQYLDGIRLYRSFLAGIRKVVSRQDYLNKINVFPVPDSDTGTNLAYTLLTIEDGVSNNVHSSIDLMSATIADTALDGARGNSGAIMAQFLVGFNEGIENKKQLEVHDFAGAAEVGMKYAYDALADPREGTMVTVIADWVSSLKKNALETDDFKELLGNSLKDAQQSVIDTPKKLDVLAKAGVVDAGGQGFVDVLEGIQDYIYSGSIEKADSVKMSIVEEQNIEFDSTFRYCTEMLIKGEDINRINLKDKLLEKGGSLVLAGSKHKVRVHIHTDTPKEIFQIAKEFGELSNEKADDMVQQQKDAHRDHSSIALVIDSGCDLPEDIIEKFNIHMVPVRLSFGDEHHVDKVSITHDEFWHELQTNPVHPKTSQPTPGDFRRQYQFLGTHFSSAVSIHLPKAVSGTYQSAETAAKAVPDFPTTIIDGKSLSIGLGLVAVATAEAIEAGKTFDEVVELTHRAIENTNVFVTLETMDYVVKGGRVSPGKKRLADLLKLNPILTVKDGKVDSAGVTLGRKNTHDKLVKFVLKKIGNSQNYRIGIAHAKCEDHGRAAEKIFVERFGRDRVIFTDVGPALGVHAGPGGLAIAIQKSGE